ncbi:MAG: xanthorhodopsin [Acidobacteria bacterium]|nr:xanthorhodopsin [Acidobacteriota bacterium]
MEPTLSMGQYSLVTNLMSLTVATMGAAALFFFMSRQSVAAKYRVALTVSGLVVAIACYHYFRILESFTAAYQLEGGAYVPTGIPFNDAYRYADWLLTVPLLLVELIAVLNLPKKEAGSLLAKLIIAAVLMIGLGYPGEISNDPGTRWLWGWLSTVPFLYILYVLFVQLSGAVDRQVEGAKILIKNARLLIFATWGFYPIAYTIGTLGLGSGASTEVAIQVGYTIADITAKAGLGVFIFNIARAKTEAEEG